MVNQFLKWFPDYQVTKSQIDYALYLERQGKIFLVEFGFENAEEIAWQHLETTIQ